MIGGWDRQDVALAQRDLVINELSHPDNTGPFKAFLWAMNQIGVTRGSLLDIGCGVGHYGVLCEHNYPGITYVGTDASEYMIAEAKQLAPLGKFHICRFEDNFFESHDIILAGQVIEVTDSPIDSLRLLLTRSCGHVILNRLRLTDEQSQPVEETTYCGYIGRTWKWNQSEILEMIDERAHVIGRLDWDNQTTLALRMWK